MINIPEKVWRGVIGGRMQVISRSPLAHIAVVPQTIFWMGMRHRLTFYKLLRQVILQDVPGGVVELGCAHGNTSAFIAKTIRRFNSDKEFHVYDSFRGLPAPTVEDGENNMFLEGEFCAPKEAFKKNFLRSSGQCELPIIHEGWLKDTLPQALPEHVAFAYVDVDLYEPTFYALTHLYSRLSPGSVVYIDDYRHPRFPGVERAVDKFLRDKPEEIVFLPPCPGYPDIGKTQGYFVRK
ncbi:MAG: TylF/MycF/NovP-related O-methyltransferase [Patescibacteria group bacterium]